jgi:outer membrane receptor protein involved in Fe transport
VKVAVGFRRGSLSLTVTCFVAWALSWQGTALAQGDAGVDAAAVESDAAPPQGEAPPTDQSILPPMKEQPPLDAGSAPAPPASTGGPVAGSGLSDEEEVTLAELLQFNPEDVTTASRYAETLEQIPGTAYVITQEDIRTRGYSTLNDVLRDLPGLEVIGFYSSEWSNQVAVRGVMGNNKIIVLVNGMRVNPPGGENMPFRNDISVRMAHQIEVIYGAGSTLYGQDAISAVINIRTIRPAGQHAVEIGGGGGWPNRYESWVGGQQDFNPDFRLSGYVHWYDARKLTDIPTAFPEAWRTHYQLAQGQRQIDGVVPDPNRVQRWDQGLNAVLRLDSGNNAYLQIFQRVGSRSSAEGRWAFPLIEQARWSDQSTVLETGVTAPLGRRVEMITTMGFNRYEILPSSRFILPQTGTMDQWLTNDFKYGVAYQGRLETRVVATLLQTRLRLMGGAVLGYYDDVPKATIPGGVDIHRDLSSQGGAFEYYTEPMDETTRQTVPRVNNVIHQDFGAYLEGSWQLIELLRITAGVRVGMDTRYSTIPVNPRAAIIFTPFRRFTIRYIFTTAYVQPSAYNTYNVFLNGAQLNRPNPNLEPELSYSNEVNIGYRTDAFLVAASGYYSNFRNLIIQPQSRTPANIVDPEIYLTPTSTTPIPLTQVANGGQARSIGGDLYGRASIAGVVSLWGSYSLVNFEQEVAGVVSRARISTHNWRLGVTVAPLPGRLFITTYGQLRSTPNLTQAEIAGTAFGPALRYPYEIGLYILGNLFRALDLYADVQNVTNHRYALAGIVDPAIPQEAFRGTIGARFRY